MATMRGGAIGGAVLAGVLALGSAGPAQAQSSPYVGSVELVSGSYCPEGTLDADGRSLAIERYEALYSLVGSTYGGDDPTMFNLPDLRGKEPLAGTRYCVVADGFYPPRP